MKAKRKGAWVYHDTRRLKTDFVMVSKASIERAMEIKSRSTYRLWLYILHEVNGRTLDRNPDGWILGEVQLRERTGISRTALYDGMQELTTLGLIRREKVGRTTHAFLTVASSQSDAKQDSPSPDASSQSDALTETGRVQKTGHSEPVQKPQCVQPAGLLPIQQNNSNNSLNLSERETVEQAKTEDEIPEEFKAIAHAELTASWERWRAENPTSRSYRECIDQPFGDVKSTIFKWAWDAILNMLRKRDGIDGLHRSGYLMGRTRKKGELLGWLARLSGAWTPGQARMPDIDLVTKYRSCWYEMFYRFGYIYEPTNSGHLKHSIAFRDKEEAIDRWETMTGCQRTSILNEKMELAIAEYGQAWFDKGEF